MATIQTAIRLTDMMTSPLIDITQALNMTVSAFESIESKANSAFDSIEYEGVRERINAANVELNEIIEKIKANTDEQNKFNESLNSGVNNSNKLLSSITKLAATYLSFQTVMKAIDLSDTLALSESRLSLIVDDGGSVEELEQKIFASAQRSRAVYQDTIDTVSKLGLLAGKSFSGNDEMIAFSELMNKNFIIGGASATEQASAMYQLTQAMASGRLQGDEYRSIIENAPLLAKSIEDYMVNVKGAEGTMKDWASEGMLTADVIKAALFSSADEIEERFNEMPMTFGQIWTSIKNDALMQFQPILKNMNDIANSKQFTVLVSDVTSALVVVSGIVLGIFNMVGAVSQFMSDNWSLIAPVVYSAAIALSIYAGYLAVTNTLEMISNISRGIAAVKAYAAASANVALATSARTEAMAKASATAAQYGFNAALLACPITWIIIAIIAIIALFYLVIADINKLTGLTISATGIIFGVFTTLGAFLWNLFLDLLDLILGVINYLINPFIEFANFIGNVFTNPISSIIYLFQGMADNVLGLLEKIASALDFVFGSNMADAVAGWRSGLKEMADAAVAEYAPNENYQNVIDELDLSVDSLGLKKWSYTDAWNTGYSAGESVDEAISNFDPASLFQSNIPTADDYTNSSDPSQYLSNISDNTDSMAGSVALSEEDLKYLRDIAERDTVNRFTTAEVKVEFGGITNNVSSEADLDGMVTYLSDRVAEELEVVAEGVHE
ncbi:MAG: tape measure protein [Oscillospiraceae bacterium]|nr:tape measure protein [Oscillospiraceae bacterium]